ncbi:MAG: acetyltransferase [Gammaproteobacteria bacterium]|jgi:hypothetical protein|nr:acetyltransferase [Gammaproteobacteria bacterium]
MQYNTAQSYSLKNEIMTKKPERSKIIIEGVTDEGKKFHPADWAERVSGSLSTFRNRRIIYSPLLQPAVKNGNKCVIVDDELKNVHPEIYQEILNFAESNHLKIEKDEGLEKDDKE